MSNAKTVFLTGVTGYVGGTYLQQLLNSPNPPSQITCLVRSPEKVKPLDAIPTVKAVVGDHAEYDLLTELAETHDITIESAESDNQKMMDALLRGMEKRHEKGLETIFIHTSGTGELADDARGEYASEVTYTDGEARPPHVLHINSLPDTAFHRKVDLSIIEADKKGWCRSYIIFPGTIWGKGTGSLFGSGISNPYSKQIPMAVQASLDRGRAGMIGKGLNYWVHVHIDDVGSHFALVYDAALFDKGPHGELGYYLCSAGEYQLLRATIAIGEVMQKHGWSKVAEPDSFAEAELDKYFSGFAKSPGGHKYYPGTNSRAESAQAKKLGWKPEHEDVDEFYQYCRDETERIGAKGAPFW
ncbi:hypothetical protein BCR39DRAFT_559271 [Naematelia encephala]|uniref:NAD(P)-binding domain-containing protein n=1 Tax=Naematelia encephala TaxID=71784 RepID=A0A1Y2B2C4_9TREE|nr:hypothetical protein BCR39DRAFT_559271 [Naematelia encephala]